MDIAGTKKKIQRATKIAEESYKKINEVVQQVEQLQSDLETTSKQVDRIEFDLAQQRALLEALAEQQGLDVEEILLEADLPEPPTADAEDEEIDDDESPSKMATSRPSATTDRE